jgi:hypothetical protein
VFDLAYFMLCFLLPLPNILHMDNVVVGIDLNRSLNMDSVVVGIKLHRTGLLSLNMDIVVVEIELNHTMLLCLHNIISIGVLLNNMMRIVRF